MRQNGAPVGPAQHTPDGVEVLVSVGSAAEWQLPDAEALTEGTIDVPHPATVAPSTQQAHTWIVSPQECGPLTDADLLHEAYAAALASGSHGHHPTTIITIAPTPGVIASLAVRPWIDHTAAGQNFAPMLITHPTPRRPDDTPEAIEAGMRGVAQALGAGRPDCFLPDVGPRVAIHRGTVLIRFEGAPHLLTTRAPRWVQIVTGLGLVLLAVGFDPLSPGTHGAEVDEYIERAGKSDRIRFAGARVAHSARHWPRVEPPSSARLLTARR
ncbi:hypothetical protein [Streptomyces misionensis]|uniref:hypothetical protein n=1 Tax=Streptomyces misionensis TaxID=67331 RepID=UPI0021BD3B22|nr:hypothetical protein [Streptomyces misionensis]